MLCVVDGISYFFLFYMHSIFCQDFDGDVPMSVLGQVTDSAFINLTVQEPTKNTMCQMSWPLADLADPWQNNLLHLLAGEQS